MVIDRLDAKTYLDFDIANFVYSTYDWPANHRGKYVGWKVAAGIATFNKLKTKMRKINMQNNKKEF